jgi:hypothetical protein
MKKAASGALEGGTVAVETALAIVPLVFVILAAFELALFLTVSLSVQRAAALAAEIGQTATEPWAIEEEWRDSSGGILMQDRMSLETTCFADLPALAAGASAACDVADPTTGLYPRFVRYTVTLDWQPITPPLSTLFGNRTLRAVSIVSR